MSVLISELFGASYKQAESHLNFLVTSKLLPQLKQGGRVVSAQPTTTKHTPSVCREGDTIRVSQAYDQTVAKSNKRFTRAFLDASGFTLPKW